MLSNYVAQIQEVLENCLAYFQINVHKKLRMYITRITISRNFSNPEFA